MGLFKGVNIGANVLKFIFAIAGVILSVLVMTTWSEKEKNTSDIIGYVDGAVNMCWIAFGICAGVAILFGIYQFIVNLKKNKGGLIGLGAFAGIIAVSYYALSKTELGAYLRIRDNEKLAQSLSEGALKYSESGLYAVYILVIVAIVAVVVAEVTKLIK